MVTTTSFDHWGDQAAGICRGAPACCTKDGRFVLADLCASWLSGQHRTRTAARTVSTRSAALMLQAGLEVERVQTIYRVAGLPLSAGRSSELTPSPWSAGPAD